jgi:hypothetical protein
MLKYFLTPRSIFYPIFRIGKELVREPGNYAGYELDEAEKVDMADESTRYEVELKKGAKTKDVLFDAEGAVICEE